MVVLAVLKVPQMMESVWFKQFVKKVVFDVILFHRWQIINTTGFTLRNPPIIFGARNLWGSFLSRTSSSGSMKTLQCVAFLNVNITRFKNMSDSHIVFGNPPIGEPCGKSLLAIS